MKGHEQLIAMRRKGFRPASVCVLDYPVHAWLWREWHIPIHSTSNIHANVMLEDGENPATLDLRFSVGLTIIVDTESLQRLDAITSALLDAGAARVVGQCIDADGHQTVRDTLEQRECA